MACQRRSPMSGSPCWYGYLRATEKTYTVKAGEVGDAGDAITVVVTFTDDGSTLETVTSAPVTYANKDPTGVPTITGTVQVGEELTANIDNIADVDGLSDPPGFMYQWKVAGMNMGSATATATYEVAADDVGKRISVEVTFTDGGGTTLETVTSALTSEVPARPANTLATGDPTIASNTGTVVVVGAC